ncbi:MAG: hypothetical protein ACOYIS_02925 [Candidatus Cloacimonadaceae bacterium]|jgi:hypothetical protein
MKRTVIILLLAVVLILTGCAGGKKPLSREAKKSLLRSELNRWSNFQAQGIAEISYKGLALRKNFVVGKTPEELRFDVLDGGIFGSAATPLISLYLGDYFSINSDFQPRLALMAAAMMGKKFDMGDVQGLFSLADSYVDEIVDTGKISRESLEINFTPKMQLDSVKDAKNKLSAVFTYTKKGEPDAIVFKIKSASIELLFDKVKYGNAKVTPLPPMDTGQGLMDLLQGGLMNLEDVLAPGGE